MNWTLEVVVVRASDVGHAKALYAEQLGFQRRPRHRVREGERIVQLNPSRVELLDRGRRRDRPGHAARKGLQLVVPDIRAAPISSNSEACR